MTYVEPIRGNPITPRNRINLYYTSGGGRAKPISNAMFYYGEIDKDPIDNPIRVTTKDEHDVHRVLPQPIHTNASGHFIDETGSPIEIFTDQLENSILIKDKTGEILYGPLNEYDNFDIVPYLEKVGGLVALTLQDLKDGKTLGGEMIAHKPGQLWYHLGLNDALDRLGNLGLVKAGTEIDNPPLVHKLSDDLYIQMDKRSLDQISLTLDDVKRGLNVNNETIAFEQGQLWQYLGDTDPYNDDGGWGIVNKGAVSAYPENLPAIVRLDANYYLKTNKTADSFPQQFAEYDPNKIYKTGEVCAVIDNDEMKYFQWYSNIEHFANKNPLEEANRFIGWTDDSKPWYWIPFVGATTGAEIFSHSAQLEYAVRLQDQVLSSVQYWRLAKLLNITDPDFNLGKVVNRYIRISGDAAGTVQSDAVQREVVPIGGGGGGGRVSASGRVLWVGNGGSPFMPTSQPNSTGAFSSTSNILPSAASSNTGRTRIYPSIINMNFSASVSGGGGGIQPQAGARLDSETRPLTVFKNYHVIL